MKLKKVIVFTLVLTLLIGATLVMTSAANTNGSIEFEAGDVKVITPEGPCCPCVDDVPCPGGPCKHDPDCKGPCDCICHDADEGAYNDFFKDVNIANDLYFGSHSILDFGRFDSANLAGNPHSGNGLNTTTTGEFTGVEVKNFSEKLYQLGVEISNFYRTVNGVKTVTLEGADLYLVAGKNIFPASSPALPGFEHKGSTPIEVPNDGGSVHILSVPSANMVKALWSGLLDIEQGTAQSGKAQAELTWIEFNTP